MKPARRDAPFEALSGPYDTTPSPHGVQASPAIQRLVHSQVQALLESSPAYYDLPPDQQRQIGRDLEKIAAYTAALVQDDWAMSKQLGQTPMLKHTIVGPALGGRSNGRRAPLARAAAGAPSPPSADEFSPRAASQVARITRETLNAIAFPTFVADLIKGTFQAIVNASIQQMEAYGNLLANVAKTVDQFMSDNITDNQARDYLASSYPGHFRIEATDQAATVKLRPGADELAKPDFKADLGLTDDVDLSDEAAEQTLVPAARRKLAQSRHQLLSTMVLMGINRIVITSGRIRAQMGFRIDTKDTGQAQSASQFDFRNETSTGAGGGLAGFFGGPSFESKTTVAYVSSTKKDSNDELSVDANLTGEVDLKFKSDYFPLERFANPQMISLIQGNTPNPSANTPTAGGAPKSADESPAPGAAGK
jgi:hypothetical protein